MTWTVTIAREDGLTVESDPVARLRIGDLDSLTELIALYQNRLYRYLVRLVSDLSVADDLFQDTWLRAANQIRRYDPNRSFDHWLFSIAHNLAIDHLRRRKPEALIEENDLRQECGSGRSRLTEVRLSRLPKRGSSEASPDQRVVSGPGAF